MGPNARKITATGEDVGTREPMTHEQVDKLLRPPRRPKDSRAEPQEQWVIKTQFPRPAGPSWMSPHRSSSVAYWGTCRDGRSGLTPYRANAHRYESENTALYEGFSLKEVHRIGEFSVEKLPAKRPLSNRYYGGSGRA